MAMFLSIAVNRGPSVQQPHQLQKYPLELTVKDLADLVQNLREDAEDAVRVEVSAMIASPVTTLQRDAFDTMTATQYCAAPVCWLS